MLRRSPWSAVISIVVSAAALVLIAKVLGIERAAGNTLLLACATVLVSLAIGLPLAFILVRTAFPGRIFAASLIAGLLFVALYLQAAAWQAVWGVQGWLTTAFHLPPLEGWPAVIWIHAAAAIPWVVLITGLGFARVEPELEDDALLDASPLAVFWHVTLRRALPAIAAAALWVASIAAAEMTVTDLYQVRTLAEAVYLQYAAAADSEQPTTAILIGTAVLTICLAIPLVLLANRLSHERLVSQISLRPFQLGRWQFAATAAAWLAIAMLAGVPLLGLLYKAGIAALRTSDGWVREWSLGRAISIVAESPIRANHELQWSLTIGTVAATLATCVGFALAWAARRSTPLQAVAIVVGVFALVVPGPLVGVGLIRLVHAANWNWLWYLYDRTIVPPALAQAIKALPLAMLIVWQAVTMLPQELLDAAAVDGAGRWGVLRHVVLPLVRRSLATAWIVAFAVALGELAATILILPPGINSVANLIFGLIHYGVDDRVAGITLAMVMAFVLAGLAAGWLVAHLKQPR